MTGTRWRAFLVHWGVATLTGWVVLVLPLGLNEAPWPWLLASVAYVAAPSALLASYLPRVVRVVGTWVVLTCATTLTWLPHSTDLALELSYTAFIATLSLAMWLALAVSAVTILRLLGVLPRRSSTVDRGTPAPEQAAYGP